VVQDRHDSARLTSDADLRKRGSGRAFLYGYAPFATEIATLAASFAMFRACTGLAFEC
jgi:hypothetical protein